MRLEVKRAEYSSRERRGRDPPNRLAWHCVPALRPQVLPQAQQRTRQRAVPKRPREHSGSQTNQPRHRNDHLATHAISCTRVRDEEHTGAHSRAVEHLAHTILIAERALSRRQLCAVGASGWWVVVGARTAHDLHRTRSRPIGFKVQGAARIAGRLRTERSTDASGAIAGGGDVGALNRYPLGVDAAAAGTKVCLYRTSEDRSRCQPCRA